MIILGNNLNKIRSPGLGTMTILSRNRVVEIACRVSQSFRLLPLHQIVFFSPITRMSRRVEHQTLNIRDVFQGPTLIPLTLIMVRDDKNHSVEFLARKERCFGNGQSGQRLTDSPSTKGQECGNCSSQSTISVALIIRLTQQGNSSSTGGGQCQNRLYALQARQDEVRFP